MTEYQSEADAFQEKEVPKNLDEIKRAVVQLEQLSGNLEKSKDEAMVSYHNTVMIKYYMHGMEAIDSECLHVILVSDFYYSV